MKKRIILASKSPRRKELLEMLQVSFDIMPAVGKEFIDDSLELDKAIEQVARHKAMEIFENNKDALVIGSDTIVVIDNKVLGKPKNEDDAKRMLRQLSGRTHQVITGVSILSNEEDTVFNSKTDVEFYELTDEEINWYVSTKEPMDKAGAYGIQGLGARIVKKINGDYFTVMGLPVAEVYKHIEKYL